tara:strand:- start:1949 stop:2539 length:591 start_codon:yes stop_codon:yes gene_type:complete
MNSNMEKNDIYIRPLRLDDINAKYISWFNNNNVTKFLDAKNISIEESKNYLIEGIKSKSYYIYAICESNNNLHIGNIKIGPIRRLDAVTDLVTVIGNEDYWGKNIASRVISMVIKEFISNSGIRKIIASIDSLNIASIHAYQNAGFNVEARISDFFVHKKNGDYIFSDKIYFFYNNINYDLEKFNKWEPILLEDIT